MLRKTLLPLAIITSLMIASQAAASHSVRCILKVTVDDVRNIDRLNGSSVYSTSDLIDSDHQQVMTFHIDEVVQAMGRTPGCFRGETETLIVARDDVGVYKSGDKLEMLYTNVGDRLRIEVSWKILAAE